MDIFIKFNSAFYEKGLIMRSHREIAINYLKSQFIWDILSLLPILSNAFNE